VDACPAGAIELLGKQINVDDMYTELIKDRSYYEASRGGITFSGGEPALQADFCTAVMERLQENGIHTALDTCGMTSLNNLEKILPHTDLVLYDLKEIDPVRHRRFTSQSNDVILKNLIAIRDYISELSPDIRLWVRTPLIPQATDTRENLTGIGDWLASNLGETVDRWELCAFNNLCRDKYTRLGMVWDYETTSLLTADRLSQLEGWAKASRFSPERVIATGATRVTD
jgi:pyruvate formate lyase activating enzyme